MKILSTISCILFLVVFQTALASSPESQQIPIESAEYVMGDPYCQEQQGNSDFCSDEVSHKVQVDGFLIDTHEVTNAQYSQCFAKGVCAPNELHEDRPKDFSKSNQPVVFVTWQDAATYCAWVNGRLPTEAEWERAAKADQLGGAHFGKNYKQGSPEEVGSFSPNSYGLFDMFGNVYEWTQDWYGPYEEAENLKNPKGPEQGKDKVVRGGAWNSPNYFLRSSDRVVRSPELRYSDVGFRCVRSVK
jgi:formylglycine-generating enzyme required for sulfatase activity